ncbi:MAG: tetratricopeptide repeat protein, partial [Xanthomonadales bacterium]|nr:tetratricopeptide repeat protein [Xanthomonadales bacterium]
PFDEPGDSVQEVWRKINEDTPLHPAQQLTMMTGEQAEAIALARQSRLKPLIRTLSEDLDAIIMKAISRDRERRYESVTAFYDDLDALLEHKPVAAQQQDFTYLAGKFIRRHIGLAIASSLLLTALAVGLVAWSGEAKRANQEAARASREAQQANQALEESRELVNFMVTLFGSTAKESGAPERMTTEEMLNLGAARIQNTETMDPLSRARLQSLLGEVYFKLFMENEAEQMVQQALATRIDLLGEEHVLVADSKGQLGAIYANEMRIDEAEPLLLEAMATAQGATTQDLEVIASIWEALGNLYWVQVRHDEARDALERALEIRQVKMGRTDEFALAAALSSLGVLHMELEEFARAEPYLEQAAEIRVRRLGNSIDTAKTLHNLAEAENQIGRMSDSAAHYRQAFEVYAAVEGREDGEALRALDGLMRAFTRAGRYEEGLLVGQRALEIRERRYGPDSEELIQNLVSMGINQGYTGDLDAARLQLERALSLANRYLPPTSRNTGAVQDALAWLAWQEGNYEEALERHQALL